MKTALKFAVGCLLGVGCVKPAPPVRYVSNDDGPMTVLSGKVAHGGSVYDVYPVQIENTERCALAETVSRESETTWSMPRVAWGKRLRFRLPCDTPVSQFLTAIAELEPMAVFRVAPAYPRRLAESNTNGYAVLRLRLNADGTVAEALAIEASHPEFAASASEAAGQWLYTPTKAGTTLDDVRLEFRRN